MQLELSLYLEFIAETGRGWQSDALAVGENG